MRLLSPCCFVLMCNLRKVQLWLSWVEVSYTRFVLVVQLRLAVFQATRLSSGECGCEWLFPRRCDLAVLISNTSRADFWGQFLFLVEIAVSSQKDAHAVRDTRSVTWQMAVAGTYSVFPSDVLLNVNGVQRVFDDISLDCDNDSKLAAVRRPHSADKGSSSVQTRTASLSLSPTTENFNNNNSKKSSSSSSSRPFDLLRWFTL